MKTALESIQKCIQKRQEALDKNKVRKAAFLASREQILKEIEEARELWAQTMEQLPNHDL